MAESKSIDWRELCAAAAREQDAAKLTCLVNQLIQSLDETIAGSHGHYVSAGAEGDSLVAE